MTPMKLDRVKFIHWAKGVIFHRDDKGKVVVYDDPAQDDSVFEEAEKRLDAGESIVLLDKKKRPVSFMTLREGKYSEVLFPPIAKSTTHRCRRAT